MSNIIVGVILIGAGITTIILSMYAFIRNNKVFNLRIKVLNEIEKLPVKKANKTMIYFNCISYDEMMWKRFFQPLSKIETEWRKELGLS